MNVINPDLVIVRGINSDWLKENFIQQRIIFGGSKQAIPKEDSFYVGFYLEAPESAISHIGIVDRIERYDTGAEFYLKAIIKLTNPVNPVPAHAIRKHENWTLSRLGLNQIQMENIRNQLSSI
jgi:hypothetical protein